MDNHPIPQDVTGFQFRLIGDMTIKQFAYLAAGVILAWICLSLPVFFLFKFPFVILFGGSGILFAFIPIGGRPADTMILYFLKAVFSQTQYSFQQPAGQPIPTSSVQAPPPVAEKKEEKKEEKVELAQPAMPTAYQQVTEKEEPKPMIQQPVVSAPALATEDTNQNHLTQETTQLSEALQEAKKEEAVAQKGTEQAVEAHKKVADLETELQTILAQKQALEAKLVELQNQLQKPKQVFTPSAAQPTATENVRKIPPSMGKTIGTPFVSDVPNLIGGIIKDPRGNVLPNILIEVKDKDGNPVRAFKTNQLGQFASATPVINGVYTITFEDPNAKQRFDTVELTANGTVLEPLEIISVDAREDLRKELFGT